jgi:nicotinate phosphoribosyltransferase
MNRLMELGLHTDFYQLTMMNGYFMAGKHRQQAVFDMYYRENPCGNGYCVMAGLEQALDYIHSLRFTDDDIGYLRSFGLFNDSFLQMLKTFRFSGSIKAVPEGTFIFPNEPIVQVKGSLFEVQLIETALLNIISHQTLIATKAARVVKAADGKAVLEFGSRRAQGIDAALYGARAAYIGGCVATSNVLAAKMFGIPARGTHAHSWVQSFESELEAFRMYAEHYPDNCVLLVDTYDTLRSGVPNAIIVGKELRERGYDLGGIRLDSGDIAYLSKQARKMLDEAGFHNTAIVASNNLDEYVIAHLHLQNAKVDTYGVGTHLITAEDCPSLGCVYKMVAIEKNGVFHPKIKISENTSKISTPAVKRLVRLFDKASNLAIADLIMCEEEELDESRPLEIFDPIETWKRKTLTNYTYSDLLVPMIENGVKVYSSPSLQQIQERTREQFTLFSEEVTRLTNPHIYYVDLSEKLWRLKQEMIHAQHFR